MSEEALLGKCRDIIEDRLGWGPADRWSNADFEVLSDRIADVTDVSLSATTLKRVWGRVAYASKPSTTTLDALARFAGYDHWRHFRSSVSPETATGYPTVDHFSWLVPSLAVAVVLGLILSFVPPGGERSGDRTDPAPAPLAPADFALDFRPVTGGIPNSVVFTYDAAAAGDSTVYLQQSWDPNRREQLDPAGSTHTSMYYLPGFYRAKLVVGNQIVRERELFLPSDGWIAAVDGEDSPVYLKPGEIRHNGLLAVTPSILSNYGIPLQPATPSTALINVRTLDGLRTDDFTFRTRFRHTYAEGSAACQRARVTLLLKDGVIVLPFSAPGCVAELNAYIGGQAINGRTTDLSAFGVMGAGWTELEVRGAADSLVVNVNEEPALSVARSEDVREIIGLQYDFVGTGAVDRLAVGRDGEVVWTEEF